MTFFGTFDFGESLFGEDYVPPDGLTTETRVPWLFQAYNGVDVYEFAVNPLTAKMPSKKRNITKEKTATGAPILFQGRDSVPSMTFGGTILTEAHLNAMRTWAIKQNQVKLTDDLGRQYWVYITSFSPTRNYHADYPWRHDYQAEALVLDW